MKREPGKFQRQATDLRRLVNAWNPIGVGGLPEDEYDCLVSSLLSWLHSGLSEPDVLHRLQTHVVSHFGIEPAHLCEPFVREVFSWYERQS